MRDVANWCHSCDACQRMGPRHGSTQVKPIMSLQPMDLMGMDFIGPITPHSVNGSIYILLAVDYFSRFLFAHAIQRNTEEAVLQFLEKNVTRHFGWPLAFYLDNGSHFVKGKLPSKLEQLRVKLFPAPITNLRSVGLAEWYVQLILGGLRTKIAAAKKDDPRAMEKWDEYLDPVVHAINTRVLRVHGYTPAQLLFGFNIRVHPLDVTLQDELRRSPMTDPRVDENFNVKEYDLRLACVEEIREIVRERVLLEQEETELRAMLPCYSAPQVGDLVLRRRFNVEKSLEMKLFSKWDGPYWLVRIARSGVSGEIADLKMDGIIGRYAFNALKVFVPREAEIELGKLKQWVTLVEGLGGGGIFRGGAVQL